MRSNRLPASRLLRLWNQRQRLALKSLLRSRPEVVSRTAARVNRKLRRFWHVAISISHKCVGAILLDCRLQPISQVYASPRPATSMLTRDELQPVVNCGSVVAVEHESHVSYQSKNNNEQTFDMYHYQKSQGTLLPYTILCNDPKRVCPKDHP